VVNFLEPRIGQINLCRLLFSSLSQKVLRESISNLAIQIGEPERESLKEGLAPPRTFLAIRGLANNSLTLYSIIVAESYS